MKAIIGERINTTRKAVHEAVEKRDVQYIKDDVQKQAAAGATHIDINAGTLVGRELESVEWLIHIIQDAVDLPLCIDSPSPEVLQAALAMVKKPPIINSISLEKNRFEPMISFLRGKDCGIVALCISDDGLPKSSNDVISRSGLLVKALEDIGMTRDRIFIDPLIQPVSVDVTKGKMAMDSVRGIMQEYQGVHTVCGLSNVSYGLPQRKIINRTFLALMMSAGLDSVILNPLDRDLMAALKTSSMLLGQDPYCMNFIKAATAENFSAY